LEIFFTHVYVYFLCNNLLINIMSRIIVPVDGSAEMNKIVEKALSLAKEMGRDVIALYVIDTPRLTKTIPPDQVAVAWESLLSEEGRKILDAIVQRGKKMGIPVEKNCRGDS
jgi:nucleotide-binding universal stress UspA family protein